MANFELHEIAFPTLTEAQIAQLGSCTAASLVTYAAGEVLFPVGDRDFKFFVVRSGRSRSSTTPARRRRPSPSTAPASSPATCRT